MELEDRKAIGPDEVSGYILKECRQEMAQPIWYNSVFSKQEKSLKNDRADITSIYKKGNKKEPFNYRPVSSTNIVCKMCGKLIKKQWMVYLERGVMTYRQFWFRMGMVVPSQERACVKIVMIYHYNM